MGKNYTPSVSMVNGALKINQTKPENRKKFMVGKIAGAELARARENTIKEIANQFQNNLDIINREKRMYGLSAVKDITELTTNDAIAIMRNMKTPPDKQVAQDLANYDTALFPYDDSVNELLLRDREFDAFDRAWNNYLSTVRDERRQVENERIEKDRLDAMFSGWKKEEGRPKRVQGEILDDDIYGRMDDSDNDNLSGDFFESETKQK